MSFKASFFNPALAKNLIKRYWPMYAAYAFLLLMVPVGLASSGDRGYHGLFVLQSGELLLYAAALAAPFIALAAFGFLYQSRSCGMLLSLPLTRTGLFCTVYFTMLLPFLGLDVLLCLLLLFDCANITLRVLLLFLCTLVLSKLAFYGFAVFCAQLTGNAVLLPLVNYLLLFAAAIAESCAAVCMECFLFDYSHNTLLLRFLSPIIELRNSFDVYSAYTGEAVSVPMVNGMGTLALYALAGVLFSALSLLLFRRRKAETAGDSVAYPILKPIFRICMTFGVALTLATVLQQLFFYNLRGTALAVTVTVLLLIGAVLGWFAAEMLIRRSVRVFREKKRGLLICLALLLVFSICCEADVLGLETYVPAESSVKSVSLHVLGYGDANADAADSATLTAITDAQLLLGNSKAVCEGSSGEEFTVIFEWELTDGRSLRRYYRLPDSYAAGAEAVFAALNTPSAIADRVPDLRGIPAAAVSRFSIDFYGEDYKSIDSTELSAQAFLDLYNTAVLADRDAGTLGIVSPEDAYRGTSIELTVVLYEGANSRYIGFTISETASNTLAALAPFITAAK